MSAVSEGKIQDTGLPIVDPVDNIDLRVNQYFSTYFSMPKTFDANDYDQVKSFFFNLTKNEQATAAFTASVMIAASDLGLYVGDILKNFSSDNANLKNNISYILNLSRRGSSLLGYEVDRPLPPNVKRQVEL
jgi:hypothetical protein